MALVWLWRRPAGFVSIKNGFDLYKLGRIIIKVTLILQPVRIENIVWSVACMFANMSICFLGCWRCFANNYLHWAATCTWLLLNLQGFLGEGLGFADSEDLVWYILFIIFVPYAMLPLPLKWCMIAGSVSAICHLTVISIIKLQAKKFVSVKITNLDDFHLN